MAIIEPGRICVITKGSDAGKEVTIKEAIDANFVKISGEHVKERRINIKHLEPTPRIGKAPAGRAAKEKKEMGTQTTKRDTKKAARAEAKAAKPKKEKKALVKKTAEAAKEKTAKKKTEKKK